MEPMEQVYRDHAQTVYRYLLALTRDPELAEELTQETFYQAVRDAARFDGSCKVSTWLCAIAKHQLAAWRRKNPPPPPEEPEIPVPSAEETALSGLESLRLMQALHALPEPQREVLYLRLLGGLSFRQIGDVFQKTENWARVTYYRGKESLKKEMQQYE